MCLRNFKFDATSSKQQPRMVQQIWLYRSRFLLQIACPNSSNQTIIILTIIFKIYMFILFLLKQSFDRETIAKIVVQLHWNCCYTNQFPLLVVILFNFWINNPQIETIIYWNIQKIEEFWIIGYCKMSVQWNAILQYIPKMN